MSNPENGIRLGDEVRDTVTGYTGIVISLTKSLFSSPRCCLQPKAMDGTKPVEEFWFDEARLETVEENHRVGFQFE